ncbi:MAG: PRTRC system ParB family protein [Rhodocyclaceae bacterium]|nr:PRTRC system ParB family protein [Rhodocyclaceae bacterium]
MDSIIVPLAHIVPGKNPRRYFNPAALDALAENIKAIGVIQPITVRPRSDGKFEIIAGERRYRAAQLANLRDIPAFVRDVDDQMAEAMSISENTEREQMTVVEEAEAAHDVIVRHDGSQAEAAAYLGWDLSKLRRRVALMNCSSAVRDALQQQHISIAMAEFLATQPTEKQDAALPTIIEKKLSVELVKEDVQRKARNLAVAIFDKAGCQGCPHNSEVQADMFANNLGGGLCTNGVCFDKKIEAHLVGVGDTFKETYRKIVILRVDNAPPALPLVADGDNGVGVEQAVACRACPEYGVAVSGLPNSLGKVREGVCFNLTCNAQKVKLAHPAPEPTPRQEAKTQPAVTGAAKTAATATAASAPTHAAAQASPTGVKKAQPKPVVLLLTNAMKEYRRKVWDKALMKAALTVSPERALSLVVVQILLDEHRYAVHPYIKAVALKFAKDTDAQSVPDETDDDMVQWAIQNPTNAPKLLAGFIACHAASMGEDSVKQLLNLAGQTIESHWKPDEALWALLTKSEIDSIGTEIGLAAHLGERWKKLVGGKKDELLIAIKESGFDFTNKIPAYMRWGETKETA